MKSNKSAYINTSNLVVPKAEMLRIEEANVRTLVQNILTVFDKHYPKYTGHWNIKVNCDPKGGMVYVRNTLISGKMGFQVPITWLHNHDDLEKYMMRYAGELLERFNLSRDKNANIESDVENMKRDFKGEGIYQT